MGRRRAPGPHRGGGGPHPRDGAARPAGGRGPRPYHSTLLVAGLLLADLALLRLADARWASTASPGPRPALSLDRSLVTARSARTRPGARTPRSAPCSPPALGGACPGVRRLGLRSPRAHHVPLSPRPAASSPTAPAVAGRPPAPAAPRGRSSSTLTASRSCPGGHLARRRLLRDPQRAHAGRRPGPAGAGSSSCSRSLGAARATPRWTASAGPGTSGSPPSSAVLPRRHSRPRRRLAHRLADRPAADRRRRPGGGAASPPAAAALRRTRGAARAPTTPIAASTVSDVGDATERAQAGGPARHREKALSQGKLPVRERVERLIDPGLLRRGGAARQLGAGRARRRRRRDRDRDASAAGRSRSWPTTPR